MASYPASVKTFTTKSDGAGNKIFASHINDLQDEVNAIESGLLNGTAPLNSSNATVNTLTVSSGVVCSTGIKERGRSFSMGEWSSFVPNFVVSSGAWQAGNPDVMAYTVVGRTLFWHVSLVGSTLTAANASLKISFPSTFVASHAALSMVRLNDGADTMAFAFVSAAGSTQLVIQKSAGGAISSGAVTLQGTIAIHIGN